MVSGKLDISSEAQETFFRDMTGGGKSTQQQMTTKHVVGGGVSLMQLRLSNNYFEGTKCLLLDQIDQTV